MSIQSIYTKLSKFSNAQGRKVQKRENERFANKYTLSSVGDLEEAYGDLQIGASDGQELLDELEYFIDQFENQMKNQGARFNELYDNMMQNRESASVALQDFNDAAFDLGVNPDDVPAYAKLKDELSKMENLRDDVEQQMRIARQYINF